MLELVGLGSCVGSVLVEMLGRVLVKVLYDQILVIYPDFWFSRWACTVSTKKIRRRS